MFTQKSPEGELEEQYTEITARRIEKALLECVPVREEDRELFASKVVYFSNMAAVLVRADGFQDGSEEFELFKLLGDDMARWLVDNCPLNAELQPGQDVFGMHQNNLQCALGELVQALPADDTELLK